MLRIERRLNLVRCVSTGPLTKKLSEMRAAAASGTLFMTLIGELSDGAIALIDLRVGTGMMSLPDQAR